SNGPQGEPRCGELSSITDQIQNPAQRAGFFAFVGLISEAPSGIRCTLPDGGIRLIPPTKSHHQVNIHSCGTSTKKCASLLTIC
ncbi:TPA: hypothetical protein ACY3ID_004794, partial [Citrobacter amalonaticus]